MEIQQLEEILLVNDLKKKKEPFTWKSNSYRGNEIVACVCLCQDLQQDRELNLHGSSGNPRDGGETITYSVTDNCLASSGTYTIIKDIIENTKCRNYK